MYPGPPMPQGQLFNHPEGPVHLSPCNLHVEVWLVDSWYCKVIGERNDFRRVANHVLPSNDHKWTRPHLIITQTVGLKFPTNKFPGRRIQFFFRETKFLKAKFSKCPIIGSDFGEAIPRSNLERAGGEKREERVERRLQWQKNPNRYGFCTAPFVVFQQSIANSDPILRNASHGWSRTRPNSTQIFLKVKKTRFPFSHGSLKP